MSLRGRAQWRTACQTSEPAPRFLLAPNPCTVDWPSSRLHCMIVLLHTPLKRAPISPGGGSDNATLAE